MEKKRAVFCISILAQELIFYSFFLSLILPWFLRCNSFLGSFASLKILLFFFLLPKYDLHQSLVLQLLSSVHTLAAILVTLIISSFLMVIKHQVFLFSQIFSLMCTKAYLTLPLESPLAPQTQMCKSNFSFSPHYTSLHSFIKAGSKLCWVFHTSSIPIISSDTKEFSCQSLFHPFFFLLLLYLPCPNTVSLFLPEPF